MFSSVLLAGGDNAAPDAYRWEAREWFAAEGRARVLVLDDASTFGAAGVGGAMDTLAWAAAAAGISSIVFGRWPADAFTLEALETSFHAGLATGMAPAAAWRAAVNAARNKSSAPSGWAGLRFVGAR